MSLINDALRRAKQEKKETPENTGGAPMQAVDPARPPAKSSTPIILVLLIAIILLGAGWFFWKGLQAKPESKPSIANSSAVESKPVAASIPEKPAEEAPIAVPATTPASDLVKQEARVENVSIPPTNVVAETNPPATPATEVAAQPAPPAQPELKLQGIFYRITNPTALINGKTVSVGEKVSGARVLKIDRQEITVELNGETKILTLP